MAKPEQVLEIIPQNELRFRGPFNAPVTSYMKLTNPSDRKVLFKIKTTAPRKYCVRPNSGVLEPGTSIEIAISLQPFVFDPTEKNKHKFMVQTLFAPDGEYNLEKLWKEINPEELMDSKLKCVFEMSAEQNESQTAEPPTTTTTTSTTSSAPTSFVNAAPPELQKAAEEVQQLREEESSLRQENLRLKEEILQLKMAVGARVQQPNRYAPPAPEQNIPIVYLSLAVVLGFLGILLGKFVL